MRICSKGKGSCMMSVIFCGKGYGEGGVKKRYIFQFLIIDHRDIPQDFQTNPLVLLVSRYGLFEEKIEIPRIGFVMTAVVLNALTMGHQKPVHREFVILI